MTPKQSAERIRLSGLLPIKLLMLKREPCSNKLSNIIDYLRWYTSSKIECFTPSLFREQFCHIPDFLPILQTLEAPTLRQLLLIQDTWA